MKIAYKYSALLLLTLAAAMPAKAAGTDSVTVIEEIAIPAVEIAPVPSSIDEYSPAIDTAFLASPRLRMSKGIPPSIYSLPYSFTRNVPDWHRLWINTAVFSGAFVGTLLVLECLPEDATSWNRSEIQKDPPLKRWFDNDFRKGPEFDGDKFIFNYVLHPYAGAVYFMAARSCGFNFWRSFLYCSIISNVGWEFGIEACMERPSYQDLFITPVVGSLIGELFYRLKRNIVRDGYTLAGSPVLGNIVAFLIDPVNEVVNLFRGSDTRGLYPRRDKTGITSSIVPAVGKASFGVSLTCTF
ncbi:MAG: DUF3943 domain-containing protein [Muribaculaceae bacterium]|nr:DUF3943 domain-containing protein [Muribaculaceae bacterium]